MTEERPDGFTQGHAGPHRLHQGDAEDHQGDADGRGVEAAPRPDGGRSRAPLCGAHGQRARQHRGLGRGARQRARAAARHRRRQDAPAGRLHRRARPVRRRSTRRSCGSRASTPTAAWARARPSSSSASAARASSSCAATYEKQIIEVIELRGVRKVGFVNAESIAERDHRAVQRGRVRRRDAVLLALQVGDRADPDRAADHPAGVRGEGGRRRRPRPTNTSRRKSTSSTSCCRATSPCRCSARCWRTPPPSRARA